MKKLMLLAAGIVASALIAACSTAQQAQVNSTLTTVGTAVADGCQVVQPALSAVGAVNPTVATAALANGAFCAVDAAATASAPAPASASLAGAQLQ